MKYIAARYVDESMQILIKLNNDKVVKGRVLKVQKENGTPRHEGRIHLTLASRPAPYTLDPDQSVAILNTAVA